MFFIKLFLAISGFLYSDTISTNTLTTGSVNVSSSMAQINIVYPWEKQSIPDVSKTFIFGNVKPYVSTITINDSIVNVYRNGSFIAYIPVSKGEFKFNIVAQSTAGASVYTRTVFVGNGKGVLESPLFELISPSTFTDVKKGDELLISVKGLKSTTVYYEIGDLCSGYLTEKGQSSGIYNGICYIKNNTKLNKYSLSLKYKTGDKKGYKKVFSDLIRVIESDFIIKTSTDGVVLKNDAGGYVRFVPENVVMLSDRREGNRYRVNLGGSKLWVSADSVNVMGFKTSPFYAETGTVAVKKNSSTSVSAKITIYQNVPYYVWEENSRLYLELYYSNLRTNYVLYDSSDDITQSVRFSQEDDNRVLFVFDFDASRNLWGYDINYSSDSALNINFKFKPLLKNSSSKPLEGLNIVIDPGHSAKFFPPYDGAVGPSGSYEFNYNLGIALKLKDRLSELGANVILTRMTNDEKEQIPLAERPRIAKRVNGDIYISIHNNAIADGEDPYSKPRGFQIYYYHLHSKKLGESIHNSFVKNIPLADEGLRYGDYHVVRLTAMPAVLVENAFMILPEQDEMLSDPDFQGKLADSIASGVVDFVR
jgi:N-acetylmuramoyl-L-alanine amidase